MSSSWLARIALCLVATSALAACGKAAPTVKPMTFDSVFTSTLASDAKQEVVQQQQDRKDQSAPQAHH